MRLQSEPRRSRIRKLLKRWPYIAGGVLGLVLISGTAAGYTRTQQDVTVAVADQQSVSVTGPLKVDLTQEIAPGFKATVVPETPGTWHEERGLLGVTAVSFKPTGRFQAGTKYTLRITNMERVLTGAAIAPLEQSFTTQAPAEIKSVAPGNGTGNVSIRPVFKVVLTSPNNGVRDLRAALTPAVPLKLISNDESEYSWTPETPLNQGAGYTFTLEDMHISDPAHRVLVTSSIAIVAEPKIVSARSGGNFGPGQSVDIVFDQAVEPDKSYFVFDTPGEGTFKDAKTYSFTPTGLKPGVTHNYKVKAGFKAKTGGVVEADRDYTFSTTGAVGATLSPGGGGQALNTAFRVAFDQAVDHASAQAHFSVSPGTAGSYSWSGNTMIYTPTALAYGTTYTYSVAPGVTPAWGLPNTRVISGSFTTMSQVVKLNVPVYKQAHNNTCEVTALKMTLAYRGISTGEMDIVYKLGYNPRARDTATNSWDNPNEMYVGNVDGFQNSTGYGVHAPPIAAAAKSYGRNATVHYGLTAPFIAQRIHEGNPVIFWGYSYPPKLDAWNTTSGVVQTWVYSHARVVVGVKGRPEAPEGFYINDSWGGRQFYWTTSELMNNTNVFGAVSNMGVVVY